MQACPLHVNLVSSAAQCAHGSPGVFVHVYCCSFAPVERYPLPLLPEQIAAHLLFKCPFVVSASVRRESALHALCGSVSFGKPLHGFGLHWSGLSLRFGCVHVPELSQVSTTGRKQFAFSHSDFSKHVRRSIETLTLVPIL